MSVKAMEVQAFETMVMDITVERWTNVKVPHVFFFSCMHMTKRHPTFTVSLTLCIRNTIRSMMSRKQVSVRYKAFHKGWGDLTDKRQTHRQMARTCVMWRAVSMRTGSLPTKKFKADNSLQKITTTVFWNAKCVLLVAFPPRREAISAAHECNTLDRL
jgi:hypothetical protein